jgi:F-type H+-transporting ATPase subunit b
MTRVKQATLLLSALLAMAFPIATMAADAESHGGPVAAHAEAVDAAHEAAAAADLAHPEQIAEEIEHGDAGAHGDGHAKKAGLPQFDPSSFSSQVFWLVIAFAVLYAFFSRKTLPEISSVIENRHQHIQNNIETAEKLRSEAEEVHKHYEELLENARQDAARFYSEAEDGIKASTEAKSKAFRDKSGKQIEDMEAKLLKAQAGVMEEMSSIAAEIAAVAAEKIVGIPADINQAKTVVQSLHNKKKAA